MSSTVLFVDGPTGVGKDYFIDSLLTTHDVMFPNQRKTVLRAVDFALPPKAQSEARKYTQYQTDVEKLELIYQGHLQLLHHIREMATVTADPSLVVINRSFLSFIHYNLHSVDERLQTQYIDNYCREFTSIMAGLKTVMLTLQLPIGSSVREVIDRVLSRQDNKPLDPVWIRTIYERYSHTPEQFNRIFTSRLQANSGQHHSVLTWLSL